jgi:pimeloyl-ACP methyl ester carboxylesterase
MTFFHAPMANYHCLSKAIHAINPLAIQILRFGYMAAFQLPQPMVRYLAVGGNYSFIRGAHRAEYGEDKTGFDHEHSMAMTMGPGEAECKTSTQDDKAQQYGESVVARARTRGAWFIEGTAYYRDGAALGKWEKSIHTLGAFHNIEIDNENLFMSRPQLRKRRTSSASSALFSESCVSSLKAPVTILWGRKDQACMEAICLDGIGDYLTRDSQVLILPNTGHWTPIENPSKDVLKRILECLVQNGDVEKKDLQEIVRDTYPAALVSIDK